MERYVSKELTRLQSFSFKPKKRESENNQDFKANEYYHLFAKNKEEEEETWSPSKK
jgi:hypothetical protein